MWWKRDTGLFVICERIEELNSYPCFHKCMQNYYYIYQSTEGRKEKVTALVANKFISNVHTQD